LLPSRPLVTTLAVHDVDGFLLHAFLDEQGAGRGLLDRAMALKPLARLAAHGGQGIEASGMGRGDGFRSHPGTIWGRHGTQTC
jgi:hypothetical protein